MGQKKEHPKAFISYSWTSEKFAMELAERLVRDGIDTIIDKWNLKTGDDKHVFMESMVNDESIDYVLILCDKAYKDKADNRKGGVGEETQIISNELYQHVSQSKFIPLIIERDENGKEYTPIYVSSRIYIDFSNVKDFENQYQQLLRTLYEEPEFKKPELGTKPDFLTINRSNISTLKSMTKAIDGTKKKTDVIAKNFISTFIEEAKNYSVEGDPEYYEEIAKSVIKNIENMLELRNSYLEFLQNLIESDDVITEDFIVSFIEETQKALYLYDGQKSQINPDFFAEHHTFLLWECFVSSIGMLWYYEKYSLIYNLVNRTYFLKDDVNTYEGTSPHNFVSIRKHCRALQSFSNSLQRLSIASELVEKRPFATIIDKKTFAYTDILLTQLSVIFDIKYYDFYWFAISYNNISWYESDLMWTKLQSKKYCEKIFKLFNVSTIEDLKKLISEHPVPKEYGYNYGFSKIPSIPYNFKGIEIGELN